MLFTVHHTCNKDSGEDFVKENAPFFSEYDPEKGKTPFLGSGYYFWDYNLAYAKVWGKKHYSNVFYIVESEIYIDETNDELFLDLVGNRKHLVFFVELLQEFNLIHEDGTKGVDLCWIIEYIRKNFDEEAFPFQILRAVDYENDPLKGVQISFNENKKSFTILNPRFIISYKNKEAIVYNTPPFITFAS